MTSEEQAAMFANMAAFASRFNRDSVRPLLQDWDRRIVLIDQDSEEGLVIQIQGGAIANMSPAAELQASDDDVVIRGQRADLMSLLDGSLNPGQAVLEDRIQVSANPEDQLKLDALSFALWDD